MVRKIFVWAIVFYQNSIRLVMPRCCRFWPSCSEYSKQAINKYGVLRGCFYSLRRLSRCHPFSGKSGYDPLQ